MSESKTATPAATNNTTSATEETIHTLWAGRPPCNFTDVTPIYWPEGHSMTHYWDIPNINCTTCKAFAIEKTKKWKEPHEE